jgi:hypothetical protein
MSYSGAMGYEPVAPEKLDSVWLFILAIEEHRRLMMPTRRLPLSS